MQVLAHVEVDGELFAPLHPLGGGGGALAMVSVGGGVDARWSVWHRGRDKGRCHTGRQYGSGEAVGVRCHGSGVAPLADLAGAVQQATGVRGHPSSWRCTFQASHKTGPRVVYFLLPPPPPPLPPRPIVRHGWTRVSRCGCRCPRCRPHAPLSSDSRRGVSGDPSVR